MFERLFQRPNCLLNRRNRYQTLVTVLSEYKNRKFRTCRAEITYNFDSLVNIICISHGIGIGWMSPTLRKLQTADSPLSFPLGVKEMSWVGSALGIGSMIGNSLSGLLINRLGSKACLLFIAIPHSVGCIYI